MSTWLRALAVVGLIVLGAAVAVTAVVLTAAPALAGPPPRPRRRHPGPAAWH